MKKLLLAFILQVPFFVFAQGNFNLEGEVKNLKGDKKIYLIHIENQREQLDSAQIVNGKFKFNIDMASPSIAILLLDHTGNDLNTKAAPKDIYRFFIEPGKAVITSKDSISKSMIKGLAIADTYTSFVKNTRLVEDSLMALNNEFAALSDKQKSKEDLVQSFQDRYLTLLANRKASIANFIIKNPNSFVSLYALSTDLATEDMDVKQVETAYHALSDELKLDPLGKSVFERVSIAKKTSVGFEAIDFEEQTAEGIAMKLSNFRGQYVLIDFWASWCGPCRQENPTVVKAYETYKDKNFTVLGVSIDTNKDKWVSAVKQDGLVWPQLLDRSQEIARTYDISSIPRNFLIDPNGVIIAKNLRGIALLEKLKEILK